MAEKDRILVVDDEPEQRAILRKTLGLLGYDVEVAEGGREAIDCLERTSFDLILADLKMPEVDGMQVVDRALRVPHPPGIILITGYPSLESAQQAIERGQIPRSREWSHNSA